MSVRPPQVRILTLGLVCLAILPTVICLIWSFCPSDYVLTASFIQIQTFLILAIWFPLLRFIGNLHPPANIISIQNTCARIASYKHTRYTTWTPSSTDTSVRVFHNITLTDLTSTKAVSSFWKQLWFAFKLIYLNYWKQLRLCLKEPRHDVFWFHSFIYFSQSYDFFATKFVFSNFFLNFVLTNLKQITIRIIPLWKH